MTNWLRIVIEITLPFPISTNDYWQHMVPKGWTRPIVHLSKEAKEYKKSVGWIAKAAGFKVPSTKPMSIALVLHPKMFKKNGHKMGSVMDLGNCWKVAEDALQDIVYVNDRQIKHIEMDYGPMLRDGALVVNITELDVPQHELFPAPLEAQIGNVRVVEMEKPF